MKRFEDIVQDHNMLHTLENLQSAVKQVGQLSDKLTMLQAALDSVGMEEADSIAPSQGGFAYIPIEMNEFFEVLFQLEDILADDVDYQHSELRHRPLTFVEVGCGIGRNVHVLNATNRFNFEKIDGFDVVEEYVRIGKKHFGDELSIFVEDCMSFDYSGYDVVYFYRPLQDERMQKRFEDYLIKTMKSGSYIIGCFNAKLEKSRRLIRKDDGGRIWKRV